MKIRDITIQNFLSIKKARIDLKKFDGLTIIKGKNLDTGGSNGSGKSSIVEAIYFALTGKTLRKSTEASLVNTQAGKGLVVSCNILLDNTKILSIERCKKPTKMTLTLDGEDITAKHANDSQAIIDELLGTNHKVLLASMFFGQSNDVNFLDCTPAVKRDIIRNFLNLDEIFDMREHIREYKSEYSQRIKLADAVIDTYKYDIMNLDRKLSKVQTDVDVDLEELEKEWYIYNRNIRLWEELDRKKESLQYGISHYEKRMEDEHPKCLTCGQTIPKDDFEQKKAEKQLELDELYATMDSIDLPVKPKYTVDYARLAQGNAEMLEGLKKEKEEKIKEFEDKKAVSHTGSQVMRFWERALSEKGIIKYIIRNVLEYFNDRTNYYLSYLTDPNFYLEFDEELSEYIKVGDQEIYYISLSGGEKRKLNLAIMMALKDLLLLTDTNHSNLLFFDEVAENIDEDGIQGLYNLLLELKKTRQIFVITHNKHLKTLLDSSKRLTVEKKKGISKIWHK